MENGNKVIWFLTGAAIGAAVALLFAPASGEETRKYIGKKAEEGRDALADAGRDLADRSREYYDKGRKLAEEAGDLFDRGRKLVRG